MIKNYNFKETYEYLVSNFNTEPERAFFLTARVYRGGGLTKDYLYLSGLKEIFQLYKSDKSKLEPLFVGKTSLEYLPIINELTARKILEMPKYIPMAFSGTPHSGDRILEYIVSIFDTNLQ